MRKFVDVLGEIVLFREDNEELIAFSFSRAISKLFENEECEDLKERMVGCADELYDIITEAIFRKENK